MEPQIEIEIKARLKDRKAVEAKVKALGAVYGGRKHQIDYYFSPPHKSLVGRGLYFRIRHDKLSGKSRMEYHVSEKKMRYVAKEYEMEISDHKMALKILALLEFKPEVTIDKVRDSYTLNECTIDLDKVKDLGNFMEIEILNQNPQKAEEKILAMAKTLGVSKEDFSKHNYFNLMYRAHSSKDRA